MNPEVLYARGMHVFECITAALIMNIPKVVTHFGNIPESWLTQKENIDYMEMLSFVIKQSKNKGFLTISANSQAAINEWSSYLKIKKNKFKLISNVIEIDTPDAVKESKEISCALSKKHNIPDDAFVVGGAFRYHWNKNPKLWIQIAAQFIKR